MTKEIFLVGNRQRLVVMNFISRLEEFDFKVIVIDPGFYAIDKLPKEPVHVFLCLSNDMDFSIVKGLYDKIKKHGVHLYMNGTTNEVSPEEAAFLQQLPGIRFPNLQMDMDIFIDAYEYNERLRKRVLVIDDEPIFLRSIKGWLEDDFEVSLVSSGKSALDFLDMHPVDLILLDYKMPALNGLDVLERLKKNERTEKIPVIFLTANNDRESILDVMRLKPEGYLLKTRTPDDIKNTVKDFFTNRIIDATKNPF